MPDEIATSDSGGTSPATNDSGSSPETNTSSLAGATGSDASVSTGAQSDASTSGQDTTAQASEDPFAKYAVPEDANIIQMREAHKQLLNDHREIQKTTQAFDPWKPLVEQYQAPEQVQSLLEIANGLFTQKLENGVPVYDNGMPVTSTLPAIQQLAQHSPGTLLNLAEELANFEVEGKPLFDWQMETYLSEQGMTLADLQGYKQWKETGGQNVAQQGGDIHPDDLAKIPAQYQDVFKGMPPNVREDILLSSEATREYMLQAAKAEVDNRTWAEQQRAAQQTQFEQAQATQRQEIAAAQETAVNETWSSVFKSLHDDFSSKGWKPSADDSASSLQYGLVLAATHAVTNPALAPILQPLMEAAGVKIDGAKLSGLLNDVDVSTRSYIAYTKMGDTMNAKIAKANADRAQFHVKTLANGVIAEIMGVLDGTAQEKRQAQDSRLQGATSRTVPNGQATNGNGQNPYALPPGVLPFSEEAVRWKQGLVTQR